VVTLGPTAVHAERELEFSFSAQGGLYTTGDRCGFYGKEHSENRGKTGGYFQVKGGEKRVNLWWKQRILRGVGTENGGD